MEHEQRVAQQQHEDQQQHRIPSLRLSLLRSHINMHNYTSTDEWISWSLLDFAYRDFLRHKRSKDSAYQYMQIALTDLRKLRDELNTLTYNIEESDAFCVTRPKLREVFVAKPRDRVVHHLLVGVFMPMFEAYSIEHSYNCRKDKGS